MSKKFLKFLVAVAVVVMAASGAWAATPTTFTWQGMDGATWDSAGNWDQGTIPASGDLAVFPDITKTVNIPAGVHEIGAIRVNSGAELVTFNLASGAELHINGDVVDGMSPPRDVVGLQIQGDTLFKGAGLVKFLSMGQGPTLTAGVTPAFMIDVLEGKKLELQCRVESDPAATDIAKLNKGVVAFTSPNDNGFDAATLGFWINDGEVQIGRVGHLNAAVNVSFDTTSASDRTATLTTTWTNDQAFNTAEKLYAVTNGTLNIAGEGSTLTLSTVANVVNGAADKTITKAGPGTLKAAFTDVWVADVDLKITEGVVSVTANEAFTADDVGVDIGEGTTFQVAKTVVQHMEKVTGSGTAKILEGGVLGITDTCTFPGYITGAGSIEIGDDVTNVPANVTITGQKNDYTGDTHITAGATGATPGSSLTINHEKNLGGTKLGRVYLQANPGLAVTPANVDPSHYARLIVADGSSFILPNEIYVGADVSERATGGGFINVPINTRLELSNNITYNQNFLGKIGEGELVISNIGYDSVGDGTFDTSSNTAVTTSLWIRNGKVRLDNEKGAALGDIIVDTGGFPAGRPVLSIRNSVKMTNSILFTNQASFQTELIDANLDEGTGVQSAVEVGKVFFEDTYTASPMPVGGYTNSGIVYNRVAFDQLSEGTIVKGQDFQLLKATSYRNYDAPKVEPVEWDGQRKAPFDPYFSNVYLYFKATHNIDVPTLGSATPTAVKPGEAYTIQIPVETTSGIKSGSPTVHGLAGANITYQGKTLVITGTAPATEGTIPYIVSVTTLDTNDTLGYESKKEYTLQVTSGDIVPPVVEPTPAYDMATPATTNPEEAKAGEAVELFYTIDSSVYDLTTLTLDPASAGSISTVTGNPNGNVKVTIASMPSSAVSFRILAKKIGDAITVFASDTTTVAVDTSGGGSGGGGDDDDTGGGSSGGCSAGFAGLALFLAAPLFLKKKD